MKKNEKNKKNEEKNEKKWRKNEKNEEKNLKNEEKNAMYRFFWGTLYMDGKYIWKVFNTSTANIFHFDQKPISGLQK